MFLVQLVGTYIKLLHHTVAIYIKPHVMYRDADKSLALPGRKQATAKEDSDFHISCL
jgi:hypothetical protein